MKNSEIKLYKFAPSWVQISLEGNQSCCFAGCINLCSLSGPVYILFSKTVYFLVLLLFCSFLLLAAEGNYTKYVKLLYFSEEYFLVLHYSHILSKSLQS